MADAFGTGDVPRRKSDGVADAINGLLKNLVIKCSRPEGVRDYYHIGIIGYGAKVGPVLAGPHEGKNLVPIKAIADNPARLDEREKKTDDGAGGILTQKVKFPIWVDPLASNGTPMCQGTRLAERILTEWLSANPNCFPPVVIHITDGESTDGDPTAALNSLTSLRSNDGNVLLFNVHLSSNPSATSTSFPATPDQLPDQYSKMLFQTASELTPFMRQVAQEHGFTLGEHARGFVLNADLVLVIQAIDIGTRPSNLR
jgi:hypothetical protein